MPSIGNESDTVPNSLHMMQHIYRGRYHFDMVKSIINTDTALMLTQHMVSLCVEGIHCDKSFIIDPKIGQNQHYRESCPLGGKYNDGEKNCENLNELKEEITWVWTDLNLDKNLATVKLMSSIPARCQAVIDNFGSQIREAKLCYIIFI